MKITRLTLLILAIEWMAAAVCLAGPAVEFDALTGFGAYDDSTVGFKFRTWATADVLVSALGVYDLAGDGLHTNHTVAIWPAGGGPALTFAGIAPGVGTLLLGHFRYVSIVPIFLPKNTDFVIGASYPANNQDRYDYAFGGQAYPTTFSPAITFLNYRSSGTTGAGLVFPSRDDTIFGGFGYFGPDFLIGALPCSQCLSADTAGPDIVLRWSGFSCAASLQTCASMEGAAAAWVPVTNTPALQDGVYSVTLARTNQAGFFRLQFQCNGGS